MIFNLVTQNEKAGAQDIAWSITSHFNRKGVPSKLIFMYKKEAVGYSGEDIINISDKKPSGFLSMFILIYKFAYLIRSQGEFKLVCHTHYSIILGGLMGKLFGAQEVYWVHHGRLRSRSRLYRFFQSFLGTTKLVDRIVCVSDTVFDEAMNSPQKYKDKLILIRNAVQLYKKIPSSNIENCKVVRIFSSGRLHPKKNQAILFDLVKADQRFCFTLAGDGDLYEEFKSICDDISLTSRCRLLGNIEKKDVINELNLCDVFVFPSLDEAFGLSVAEAISALKPVVCFDIPAMREVADGYAIFVKENQLCSWYDGVLSALDLTEQELLERRYKIVEKGIFSYDKMIGSYFDLICN